MGSCVVIGCEVEVGFYRWNFILRGKENRNYKVIAVGERIQGRFCKGMLKEGKKRSHPVKRYTRIKYS